MTAFKPANGDRISNNDPELIDLFPKTLDSLKSYPPQLRGNTYLLDGEILEFTKSTEAIASIITTQDGSEIPFSSFARCNKEIAIKALDSATRAFDKGRGVWPSMSMKQRAERMAAFLEDFRQLKDQLAAALMWDICKSQKDATDEVDRTIGMFSSHCAPVLCLHALQNTFSRLLIAR